jgi:hypothetical protein
MRIFETGATRDTDCGKLDYESFLSPVALKRYAEYMHSCRTQADGNVRDGDNWQKGIPTNAYMKSLLRHVMEVWLMHRDADGYNPNDLQEALSAILFNAFGYLHEHLKEIGKCSS